MEDQGWTERPERFTETEERWHVKPNTDFILQYQKANNWIDQIVKDPRMGALNKEVDEFFAENKETDDEFSDKEAFREALQGTIEMFNAEGQLNWNFRVFLTGSTISGLATRKSDVDLCIFMPSAHKEDVDENKGACLRILQIVRHMLYRALQKQTFPYEIEKIEIIIAHVQLLKIVLETGLEVDLSVCTDKFVSGCHNSFLIRGYSVADDRFARLCIFIKKWATVTRFKDPHPNKGRFNSYAIVMLVIHFLQSGVYPPVLPNIQKLFPEWYAQSPEVFPSVLSFRALPIPECEGEKNTMSVGELFLRFLIYYLHFDWKNHYVSIRHSARLQKDYRVFQANNVFIEDPMDEHNPGRTVKDVLGVKTILSTTLKLFEESHGGRFPSVADLINSCVSLKL